ncbi:hypothetical protein [Cellulomonas composti]|uniref:Zinc ribbon domain-containing protein n=1 Tax=Cellulomonas composti TaxID=266130 RepID=A0A511JE32_9CELL|nr:hypothetical protein [Cellulomonas composti]GEL95993.1 hypothetical protein CCO02nite_26510 [Cellulomonas composti]
MSDDLNPPDLAPAAASDTSWGAPPAAPEATVLQGRCSVCGAQLAYAPGTRLLECGSCGNRVEIARPQDHVVEEHSYAHWVADHGRYEVASIGGQVLRCQGCGASTETKDVAGSCQFCGGALVSVTNPAGVIVPEGVLPFQVDGPAARDQFRSWVRSRWFAPGALKKVGDTESLQGTYLPHWTFDAETTSDYTGQRGEHYWVKEGDQQVRKTRWYGARGTVELSFDDVLVPGSTTLPTDRVEKLGPWSLDAVEPYQPEYLLGHSAVRYDVDPQAALPQAQAQMDGEIRDEVKRDIGGDEQQVHHVNTRYDQLMFKLILLPIWIATFMYAGRQWQVTINANTGEVVGQRPYSVPKIMAATIVALIVVSLLIWYGTSRA